MKYFKWLLLLVVACAIVAVIGWFINSALEVRNMQDTEAPKTDFAFRRDTAVLKKLFFSPQFTSKVYYPFGLNPISVLSVNHDFTVLIQELQVSSDKLLTEIINLENGASRFTSNQTYRRLSDLPNFNTALNLTSESGSGRNLFAKFDSDSVVALKSDSLFVVRSLCKTMSIRYFNEDVVRLLVSSNKKDDVKPPFIEVRFMKESSSVEMVIITRKDGKIFSLLN